MSSDGRSDAADPALRRRIDDERFALARTVEELAARLDWRSRLRRRSMVIRDTARARWHRLVRGSRRRPSAAVRRSTAQMSGRPER
jgi:hypothetical protein